MISNIIEGSILIYIMRAINKLIEKKLILIFFGGALLLTWQYSYPKIVLPSTANVMQTDKAKCRHLCHI